MALQIYRAKQNWVAYHTHILPQGVREEVRDTVKKETNLKRTEFPKEVKETKAEFLRKFITHLLGPRRRRRNFYHKEEHCPEWWRRTGVPFVSVNHPPRGVGRMKIESLRKLYESAKREKERIAAFTAVSAEKPSASAANESTSAPQPLTSQGTSQCKPRPGRPALPGLKAKAKAERPPWRH
ncbi:uncharacterized protein LOC128550555 [Mercenaria mercenaria]|uniref:uncharacterized protein LOC128550555 n=1 Tax=Mercenaria mercenaria TaxID=6596 RepID=UPI00234F6F49|nr:uncharacterized protein LOC128550555 [Mercenaria mercenaria]